MPTNSQDSQGPEVRQKRRYQKGDEFARLDSQTKIEGDCLLFTGALTPDGYGNIRVGRGNEYAHRLSWKRARGTIPKGKCVLHKCDIRNCVNPLHLFLGTRADNVADMLSKGRERRGENCSSAKLSNAQVDEIRRDYRKGNGTLLARKFSVAQSLISRIVNKQHRIK